MACSALLWCLTTSPPELSGTKQPSTYGLLRDSTKVSACRAASTRWPRPATWRTPGCRAPRLPGWDVYFLEAEWREWIAIKRIVPQQPDRHLLAFCKKKGPVM